MDGEKVVQFVVVDITDVPKGYAALSAFGPPSKGKNATLTYRELHRAWSEKKISGCKLVRTPGDTSGPVFLDAMQCQNFLRSLKEKAAKEELAIEESRDKPKAEVLPATSIDSAGIVSALRSMLFELRRIGNSLETLSQRAAAAEAAATAEDGAGGSYSPDGQWMPNG